MQWQCNFSEIKSSDSSRLNGSILEAFRCLVTTTAAATTIHLSLLLLLRLLPLALLLPTPTATSMSASGSSSTGSTLPRTSHGKWLPEVPGVVACGLVCCFAAPKVGLSHGPRPDARMRSQVQVYQWKETKKQEKKKDSLGGGETTVTHYEYSKIWSDTQIDSTSFHQPSHSNSISIAGLQCGTEKIANTTVKYGAARQKIPEVAMTREMMGPNLHFGFWVVTLSKLSWGPKGFLPFSSI